jgi:hypothetical protein
VHFDLPWNPAVFEQRVGRVWRLGQTEKVDVYSLIGEGCIETRMAGALQTKQAAFSAVFDGDSDEVRFEEQGGFLRAAKRLVDDDGVVVHADGEDAEMDQGARPATEPGRAVADRSMTEPSVDGGCEGEVPDAREPARGGPILEPARVRSVLAGLSVQPRSDGGLVIEADRESAAVLAEVLRGLAGAIEGAAADPPRR